MPLGVLLYPYTDTQNYMTTQEIKGTLAKLLATENLVVEHRVCETASFDVDRRVLVLPIWKDLDNDTYDLLVGHEVGHALYTPTTEQEAIPGDIPRSYVNVTEDARIEKKMKHKFPGLSKSFYRGYQHLHERDFFNVQGTDLSQLKLIDRINLHFKIGTYAMIPFQNDEEQYVDLVDECETFSDCVDAARVIYDLEKQKQKEQQENQKAPEDQNAQSGSDPVAADMVDPGDNESGEQEYTDDTDSQGWDDGDDPAHLDVPSYEQSDIDEAETDTALQDNLQNHASKDAYENPTYIEIDDPDLDVAVVDHKDVSKVIESFWVEYAERTEEEINFSIVDKNYRKFQESSNREVNYLVKEFECRKSAASYARQTTSRTGVIDCTKLHTYKYSEDIFKKVTSIPDGKNHGLIFLLDWSGSMSHIIHDTIKQLLSLTSFCRKVGIPFEVYSFVVDGSWHGTLSSGEDFKELTAQRHHTYAFHKAFRLVNLLSSRARSAEYENSALNLFRIGNQLESRSYGWERRCNNEWKDIPIPGVMSLGGTPLNDAIAAIPALEKKFQKANAVENLNVVILSDGESNNSGEWLTHTSQGHAFGDRHAFYSAMGYRHHLRNRKNGRVYGALGDYMEMTRNLISYVRDVCPTVNVVGFRVAAPREAQRVICNWTQYDRTKYEPINAQFKKNKAAVIPECGYNELYVISATALDNEVEFEVQEDATKSQIRTAFKKTLKSKAANKKVLTSFIKQIA